MTKIEEKEDLEKEIYKQKTIAYYSSALDALHESCFEKDKSLLNLSALGIGLNSALITNQCVSLNFLIKFLFIFSSLFFVLTIILVLYIFEFNKDLLNSKIRNIESDVDNYKSLLMDKICMWFFIVGVILTILMSIIKIL